MCTCVSAQSCLTLCNPLDCSLPGSSVHGNFQARILPGSEPTISVSPALAGKFITTELGSPAVYTYIHIYIIYIFSVNIQITGISTFRCERKEVSSSSNKANAETLFIVDWMRKEVYVNYSLKISIRRTSMTCVTRLQGEGRDQERLLGLQYQNYVFQFQVNDI